MKHLPTRRWLLHPGLAVVVALTPALVTAAERAVDLATPDQTVVLPLTLSSLERLGALAINGPSSGANPLPYAFDAQLDTRWEAPEPGKVQVQLRFRRP